jgi:hypothetical protein
MAVSRFARYVSWEADRLGQRANRILGMFGQMLLHLSYNNFGEDEL